MKSNTSCLFLIPFILIFAQHPQAQDTSTQTVTPASQAASTQPYEQQSGPRASSQTNSGLACLPPARCTATGPGASAKSNPSHLAKINGHVYKAFHPLRGAEITLISSDTNFTTSTKSDKRGFYEFKNLITGNYILKTTIAGTVVASEQLPVQEGQALTQDLRVD